MLINHLTWSAATIGRIYKDCWQIELFFKVLKQNLCIRTFVGTSENAVKTQIWIALNAILLLKFLQLKSQVLWSLSNLLVMICINLTEYTKLWLWLSNPFEVPKVRQKDLYVRSLFI